MRKYQQLCLIVVSFISVVILIMYRNENSRLKYVLEVVNFFGRNDAVIFDRLDNETNNQKTPLDFGHPQPIWQRIGNDFHIYSSYWQKNQLASGGEVISLVVGLAQSIVSFKCSIEYANDKRFSGKFVFVREDIEQQQQQKQHQHQFQRRDKQQNEQFNIYKFYCKINRDFGDLPKRIYFTDIRSKTSSSVLIRNVNSALIKQHLNVAICLNLITVNNENAIDSQQQQQQQQQQAGTFNRQFLSYLNLLQYFLHYNFIGLNEFIVYDNSDAITDRLYEILTKNGIKIHRFPFNFPYESENIIIKKILEMDCLMRTKNIARYSIITQPNQYLYPNESLRSSSESPVLKSLKIYSLDEKRFEIVRQYVCTNYHYKILSDNLFYINPTIEQQQQQQQKIPSSSSSFNNNNNNNSTFYIFRPDYNLMIILNNDTTQNIHLDRNQIFLNEYIYCKNRTELSKWRSKLNQNYLKYIDLIGKELRETLEKL